MAQISITGSVCCKAGESPLTIKTFDNGDSVATLSVVDNEYFFVSKGADRPGQFYRVEIRGKAVEIAKDRIVRGAKVTVHGQLIQRPYGDAGRVSLEVKNVRIQYLDPRPEAAEEDAPF